MDENLNGQNGALVRELRAAEDRFRTIITRSADGIVVVDRNGVIRFLNPAAERMFGRRAEEVVGADFGYPVQAGETTEFNIAAHLHFCQDQGRRQATVVEMRVAVSEWEGESVLLATLRDITARRHAEQELRKLYRAIQQSTSIVMITDNQGNIDYVNPKFTEVTGYGCAEVVGQNPRILKSGLLPSETYADMWNKLVAGEEWRGELVNRKKGGELYWESASISPVRDAEWNITHYVAVKEDITERKRIEDEVRRSRERLVNILESISDAFFVLDRGWQFSYVNRRAVEMLGKQPDEVFGRNVWDMYPQVAGSVFYEQLQRAMAGETVRFEGGFEQSRIWLLVHAYPSDEGISVFVTDISVRKQIEDEVSTLNRELTQRAAQLESSNRELEAFSYTVSHDLRTPLTVLSGMGQLLLERYGAGLDETGRDVVRTIVGEAERMDDMIGALLNFAQLTLSDMVTAPVDLSQIARTISVRLQFREPARRVEFRIQDGIIVQGDPTLLHNVMENLLGNAWKFTGGRERAVIEFGSHEEGAETVCFIRDNGVGFAMADAVRIFGTFERLDNGSGFTGTGVGLATVTRIIGRHGGRVWAEGTLGEGATFYFAL